MRARSAGAALVCAALACAAPASGHVVLKAKQAPAGSDYAGVFVVEHGCDGSPTKRLGVRMPDGVADVRPADKAGWKVSASQASAASGARIGEVVWLGGLLAPDRPGEFAVAMRLPDTPGVTLYFRAMQECERGIFRWTEIPLPGELPGNSRFPAAPLRLLPASR